MHWDPPRVDSSNPIGQKHSSVALITPQMWEQVLSWQGCSANRTIFNGWNIVRCIWGIIKKFTTIKCEFNTCTISSIWCESKAIKAVASERTYCVDTNLLAVIDSSTLIYICFPKLIIQYKSVHKKGLTCTMVGPFNKFIAIHTCAEITTIRIYTQLFTEWCILCTLINIWCGWKINVNIVSTK